MAGMAISLAACHASGHVTVKKCSGGHCSTVTVSASGTVSDPAENVAMSIGGYYYIFTTKNVVMTNGSYTGTLAIYDSNNNLIASTSLPYYVSGNEAHLSNPSETETWVENHFQSGNTIKPIGNFPYTVTNPNATQARVTVTVYTDSQSIASGTSSFNLKSNCQHPARCHPN